MANSENLVRGTWGFYDVPHNDCYNVQAIMSSVYVIMYSDGRSTYSNIIMGAPLPGGGPWLSKEELELLKTCLKGFSNGGRGSLSLLISG